MKKEDLLNDEFLKQFKNGDELNNFLSQLQKRGIEKILEGELDGHLDYNKRQKSEGSNAHLFPSMKGWGVSVFYSY